MPTPQPGTPTNPLMPDDIRRFLLRPPTRARMDLPALPTPADYAGAVGNAYNSGEDEIRMLLETLHGENMQAQSAADFARNALTTGLAAPMPVEQAPTVNPWAALASVLGGSLQSTFTGRPEFATRPIDMLKENQQQNLKLAIQKREENLANLRANAERLAAQAEKMGNLELALKYQHKIETIDKQREAMATSAVHGLDTQAAERQSVRSAETSMYGADLGYAGQMNNAMLDYLKPTGGGSGSGVDKGMLTPEEWDKQYQSIYQDYGALVKTGFNKENTKLLARQRFLGMPPRPVSTGVPGQYRVETPDEYRERMFSEGKAIAGTALFNPANVRDRALVTERMLQLWPEEMQARMQAAIAKQTEADRKRHADAEDRARTHTNWVESLHKEVAKGASKVKGDVLRYTGKTSW